jgi:hypothetical protein
MSDIHGNGYGDQHDWEYRNTEQMPNPLDRSSLFICRKCGEYFRHYYHITENIHDAMKQNWVNEKCGK